MRHFLILRASEQNARANAVGHVVNGEIIRDFVQLGDHADALRLPQASAPKFLEKTRRCLLKQRLFWPRPFAMRKFDLITKR